MNKKHFTTTEIRFFDEGTSMSMEAAQPLETFRDLDEASPRPSFWQRLWKRSGATWERAQYGTATA